MCSESCTSKYKSNGSNSSGVPHPIVQFRLRFTAFFCLVVGLVGWFVCFSFFLFCFIVQIDCIRITCMDLSNEKQAQLPAKIHCQFRHLLNLPRLAKVLNTHLCSNFKENEWQLSTFKNLLVCFMFPSGVAYL